MTRIADSTRGLGMTSRVGNKKNNTPFTDYLGKTEGNKVVIKGKPEITTGYFSTDDVITI